MSDYTPTTEEVREGWVRIINEDGSPSMLRISPENFDRWLAEVKAQEAKAERERIIKLLEERHHGEPLEDCFNLNCKNCPHVRCYTCMEEYPCFFVEDIALIKGEEQ